MVTLHRYSEVQFIKNTVEVAQHCYNFTSRTERNGDETVKRVHFYKARELLSMRERLKQMGIDLTASTPYSLQENGLAERMTRNLLDKVRLMLKDAGMPFGY